MRGCPRCDATTVPERLMRRNVAARLKTGSERPVRQQQRPGVTKTVSFTMPPRIDQAIEDLASELHMSRSEVVRQAIAAMVHARGREL